ncbi:MAG: hypothetical protein RBR41_01700 [Desulfovibrio sp.]|uniref:hypothetical protein n=1 Tax=Desulfovibrio sp. TaxID=885 RepID=UPI002A36D690|nr:hypothetical protein [Desulfovibrio sp.]MDY0258364.1 hypothetical protein [Desulfovibrio sp.]
MKQIFCRAVSLAAVSPTLRQTDYFHREKFQWQFEPPHAVRRTQDFSRVCNSAACSLQLLWASAKRLALSAFLCHTIQGFAAQ